MAADSSSFQVLPYSIHGLKRILSARSSKHIIEKKLHIKYFEEYFSSIGVNAKTILLEKNYVDHDYLDDFAEYYVRCFKHYKKRCSRLHFFTNEFQKADLEAFLAEGSGSLSKDILEKNYLGFIVVKPLPQTIIGKTCLKTYAEGHRRFPILREYKANVLGIEIPIKSLAFQEQDSVVAACATSALWSVFHGTGILFHHTIPSPVEITKAATTDLPFESRVLPNKGLSSVQMAKAIKTVGLEPFLIRGNDEFVLKGTLYAYLMGGIPALLGIEMFDTSKTLSTPARHAVAVAGFNLGLSQPVPLANGFLLSASKIDKIYAHDDQVGPFARMVFDGKKISTQHRGDLNSLSTSWSGQDGKIGSLRAVPDIMLLPLYNKIRIPFMTILETIMAFDLFFESFRPKLGFLPSRLEWDIYLTNTNKFKSGLMANHNFSGPARLRVLSAHLPRFIWRATARTNGQEVMDVIFDATDIEQGKVFIRAIDYEQKLPDAMHRIAISPGLDDVFNAFPQLGPARKILHWYRTYGKSTPVSGSQGGPA